MTKTVSRWYSPRCQMDIALARWGHYGQPVLLFPTAGGDAEEAERMHLIAAIWPLIEAGRIKVYCCDSVAGRALAAKCGNRRAPMLAAEPVPRLCRARSRARDPHRLRR